MKAPLNFLYHSGDSGHRVDASLFVFQPRLFNIVRVIITEVKRNAQGEKNTFQA